MKQFCVILLLILTGTNPGQVVSKDTIADNREIIVLDSAIYNVPVKSELDKQLPKMQNLKDEAKDLYNKSIELEKKAKEVKMINDANDMLLTIKKARNQ